MTTNITTVSKAAILLGMAVSALASSCGGGGAAGLSINPGAQNPPAAAGASSPRSYFDNKGSTGAFGIPDGVTGSISAGQAIIASTCSGCHGSGQNLAALDYSRFTATLQAVPAMRALPLTQQDIADLVAWLNRNAPPPPSNTGGGTPPPSNTGGGTPPPSNTGGGTPPPSTGGGSDDGPNHDINDDNGDDSADDDGGSDDSSSDDNGGDDSSSDDNGGDDGSSDDSGSDDNGSDDDSSGDDD
jgi:mono/diheme cytochrome c family protein